MHLNNNIKDGIRQALETAGIRTSTANIEMVYQCYMGGDKKRLYGDVVKELKQYLR